MSVVKSGAPAFAMLATASVFAAVTIDRDPAKPGAAINKNVYGQFAEHLGTGIDEGMRRCRLQNSEYQGPGQGSGRGRELSHA